VSTVAPRDDADLSPIEWKGMTFRSWSEVRLARAFEDRGLLYIPNARARVGILPRRETRELDALVNVDGLWVGIESTASRSIHRPDRLPSMNAIGSLLISGVVHVFRFDGVSCTRAPIRLRLR
jgi:hypothetical protein